MIHIFYSDVAAPGEYTDGEGNYIRVEWKAFKPKHPDAEEYETPTQHTLDRIMEAVEGIYELMNRRPR